MTRLLDFLARYGDFPGFGWLYQKAGAVSLWRARRQGNV